MMPHVIRSTISGNAGNRRLRHVNLPHRSMPAVICGLWAACLAVACLLAAGCGGEDVDILVYEIPKDPQASAAPATRQRMLAAIIRNGSQAWFVKLTGPEKAVTGEIEPFVQLVRSFQFDDKTGQPQWKLPEGWKDAGKRDAIRFATLTRSTDSGDLEITVTVLPASDDWDAYVLQNINRWRGQLGREPIAAAELSRHSAEVPLQANPEQKAIMVSIEGTGGGSMGRSTPPMARRPSQPSPATSSPTGPSGSSSGTQELAFELPPGWKTTKNDTFSRYAFVVEGEDAAARVTVTPLRANADPAYLLANVNRWRAQVNLEPLTPEQFAKEVRDIPFLGGQAKLIVALPQRRAGLQGILGVIGIHGQTAWFIKMKGDAELLEEKRGEFETFVRSIRLK